MEKKKSLLTLIIVVLFLGGVIGHLFEASRSFFLMLTPYFLLFVNLLVLYLAIDWKDKAGRIYLLLLYLTTLGLEILGVKTGLVFGAYSYSETLGPTLFEVPLIIGLNWAILIMGAALLTKRAGIKSLPLRVFSGSLLMVFLDLFLEQVAIGLGYWQWAGGDPPLQNYLAWFVISLFGITLSEKKLAFREGYYAMLLFLVQLVYFIILSLFF